MKLIGKGAQADIFLHDGKALKIYKYEDYHYAFAEAKREADLQEKAYKRGLPVPEIFEVTEIDGKAAIVMEYVQGKTVGEIMFKNMKNMYEYLSLTVDLQLKLHQIEADEFPEQSEKLIRNITDNPYLDNRKREELLKLMNEFKTDNKLCHGDFHMMNLIQTSNEVKIIDWVDARSGNTEADVCRSYLLYLNSHENIAELYLEIYCEKANMEKQDILKWLPVIAGARLNENVADKNAKFLMTLVNKRD
ncbi:MAG: phosphotransferase [Oscillospiraceae bacterium]|nr:phosphotransferase [Oscillospiraceae bacterium]